ncbi:MULTISPECIES: hypothetical protein [Streptomyces]|nr:MULTISPECIES: hypothetical protein [unclassified Streptomyces]WSD99577.1 hypothetical protein OG758_38670 [Streptomyces sp. NBC_01474]
MPGQQGIKPGEDYEEIVVHSASAAGSTLQLHKICPPKARA